jgi:hypothetical protein
MSTATSSHWTKEKILEHVRNLRKNNEDLSYNRVATEMQGLLSAANYHFGSWKNAVEAAGINYDKEVRRIPKWTKERIVSTIQNAHKGGVDLSWTNVSKHRDFAGMAYAAIRDTRFGSWDDALSAAGLDPAKVRRYEAWDTEKIIRRIKERYRKSQGLNSKTMQIEDCKLFNAALKRYGGWDTALEAAGVDPDEVYKRHRWNKVVIKKQIKDLYAKNADLAAPAMRKDHSALYSAACKYFGSWTVARKACGLRRNFRKRGRK